MEDKNIIKKDILNKFGKKRVTGVDISFVSFPFFSVYGKSDVAAPSPKDTNPTKTKKRIQQKNKQNLLFTFCRAYYGEKSPSGWGIGG